MTGEYRQTRLLARSFFSRLFESDLMPAGIRQEQIVIAVIAFLGGPALMLPLFQLKKYVGGAPADAMRIMMAGDRTLAILLSMTATAFISLVIWENLFPDRRDSRILGVLPIRNRSFVVARLLAIVTLFTLLCLVTTAISAVAFGILSSMAGFREGFLRGAAGHFIAVAGAQGFTFFGIVTIQCALLSLAGPTAAHRLAVALQMVIIIAVLQMPLALPPGAAYGLDETGRPVWAGMASTRLLPPMWFLTWYESLAGAPHAGTAEMVRVAVLLSALTPVLALALYAASYRRLTRLAVEGRPTSNSARRANTVIIVDRLSGLFGRTPEGAAVCAFTLRTLTRSRPHRMILAVWFGAAVALSVSAALPFVLRNGWSVLDRPREAFLVGPFIAAALVQTGMRSLFAIPVDIRANWAIRLREPARLSQLLGGAAAALVLCGVVPPAVLAFATGAWLWGAGVGVMHAAYSAVMALILVQVLMRGLDKVPFTCTYSPGTAKIGTFWPLYLTLFSMFTYTAASIEAALLPRLGPFALTLLVLALVAAGLWRLRLRGARELNGLCFEAEPDGALTVVSL